MLQKFLDKLTKNILNDPNFAWLLKMLNDNKEEVEKYLFSLSCVKDIKKINIKNIPILLNLFNFETAGRGDKRGRGELLTIFLIEDVTLNDKSDLKKAGKLYEVKAYKKSKDAIAFGVENTFTITPFGLPLLNLFADIRKKGLADENFRKEFPFWFNLKNKGNHAEKWKVIKFLCMEITEAELFTQFPIEIPKLKGIINHEYVDNIQKLRDDIEEFNTDFNNREAKILLYVDENLYSDDAKYKAVLCTQARMKMRLDE